MEILVSVAILGLLIAGIFAVLNIAEMSWHSDMGLLDLQQQARLAMDGMVREIRQNKASDIIIPDNSGVEIKFKIPDSPYCFKYSLNNYEILRDISDECLPFTSLLLEPKVLANDINSLNFSLSGNIVEIQLRAKKTVQRRELCFPVPCDSVSPKSLIEQVRLRNE